MAEDRQLLIPAAQRESSIRTRIETFSGLTWVYWGYVWLRENLPSEQGLKLQIPQAADLNVGLRENLPSEQGLKHTVTRNCVLTLFLRENLPSEQGLKRRVRHRIQPRFGPQRESSIRTRIETTTYSGASGASSQDSERIFHQNKD